MRRREGEPARLNQTIDHIYWDIIRKGSDNVRMSWKRPGVVRGMSRTHVIDPARLRQCEKMRKMRKSAVSEIAGSSTFSIKSHYSYLNIFSILLPITTFYRLTIVNLYRHLYTKYIRITYNITYKGSLDFGVRISGRAKAVVRLWLWPGLAHGLKLEVLVCGGTCYT